MTDPVNQSVGANSRYYLRNAWYVAATSDAVRQDLQPVRMLGTNLVLYRTEAGKAVALEDACPHRKLPLSMGRLVGDTVECGYHGLTFDALGKCVAAPTQDRIPPTAVVRSYPTIDRYGLLWIWMGNTEEADESLLLNIENYDNPDWHITSGDSLTCACNYLYLVDNLLDPSHVAWVHRSSFAAAGTADTPLEMNELENGLMVSRWIYDCDAPPFYQPLIKFEGKCDRLQHYEVQFPSVAINKGIYSPAGQGGPEWVQDGRSYEMISYNLLTPIDENNTRYFWLQQRNTDTDDEEITRRNADGARQAFIEDKVVLEAVHKGIASESSRHINLGLDVGAVRFRTLLQEKIAAEISSANDERN